MEPVRMTVEGMPDSRSRNGVTGVSHDAAELPAMWAWRGLVFWLAVMIAGHAVVLNEPFVNQEVAFSEGARGLAESDYADGLTRFWRHQVNPLGYSAVTALIRTALHQSDSYWTARLASLAGGVLILVSGYFWFRKTGSVRADLFWLWGGVTTLCPLVWIFTGRGTADVLPVGILCSAFTACWLAEGRWTRHFLAAGLLALATVIKYNTLLTGLGFIWLVLRGSGQLALPLRTRLSQAALYGLVPGVCLTAYFAWVYGNFHVLFVQEQFRARHSPFTDLPQFPAILAAYSSYLVMLTGLLAIVPLVSLWRPLTLRSRILLGGGVLVLATGAAAALRGFEAGEMGFGGFDRMLPAGLFVCLRGAFLVLAATCAFELCRKAISENDELCQFLLAALIPTLLISSCSRPAQRYLLVAVPWVFFALTVLSHRRMQRLTRLVGWSSVAIFCGLSGVATVYGVAHGRAADRMARWIVDQGLAAETEPGDMRAHCDQYFPIALPTDPKYVVQAKPVEGAIHTEAVSILGRSLRGFYLVPADAAEIEPSRTAEIRSNVVPKR
ncbi:MAG TPA: hypothetical protein VGM05_08715 [Planctomycetaceae bacterium]|jgi:hypothetical protein